VNKHVLRHFVIGFCGVGIYDSDTQRTVNRFYDLWKIKSFPLKQCTNKCSGPRAAAAGGWLGQFQAGYWDNRQVGVSTSREVFNKLFAKRLQILLWSMTLYDLMFLFLKWKQKQPFHCFRVVLGITLLHYIDFLIHHLSTGSQETIRQLFKGVCRP